MRDAVFIATEAAKGFLWTVGVIAALVAGALIYFALVFSPMYFFGEGAMPLGVIIAFGLVGALVRATGGLR